MILSFVYIDETFSLHTADKENHELDHKRETSVFYSGRKRRKGTCPVRS